MENLLEKIIDADKVYYNTIITTMTEQAIQCCAALNSQ